MVWNTDPVIGILITLLACIAIDFSYTHTHTHNIQKKKDLLMIKYGVDVGCGPNHTPERALDARAATDRRTQRGCHSYVVKNGEVYKQTTKG
jgi:hypothetical protein